MSAIVYLKIGHNSKLSDILVAYKVVRKSPRWLYSVTPQQVQQNDTHIVQITSVVPALRVLRRIAWAYTQGEVTSE